MFIEERLEKILELVHQNRKVTVDEAMGLCNVSADTVRRDFTRLAKNNVVIRTHGGIMVKTSAMYDSSTSERRVKNKELKERIGRRAAELIPDGGTIAVDAGTTTVELLQYLNTVQNLTLLCYSLDIANEAVKYDQVTTMILGGIIRNKTSSVVGPDTAEMVRKLHADVLFLGATAFDSTRGLMTSNRMEADVKESFISIADTVVLLLDSSKIRQRSLFAFCPTENLDIFITDSETDRGFIEEIAEHGVETIVV